jgi:hypothetical protein
MQDFTTINIGNKIERFLQIFNTAFHISILYNTLSLEPLFVFDFHRNFILIEFQPDPESHSCRMHFYSFSFLPYSNSKKGKKEKRGGWYLIVSLIFFIPSRVNN